MANYSCSLSGDCEEDHYGNYHSLADCRQQCQGLDRSLERDLILDYILKYNPEQALELAPSDKREWIRRLTGIQVSIYLSSSQLFDLVLALQTEDWFRLYYTLKGYVEQKLDPFDLLIVKVAYELKLETSLNLSILSQKIDAYILTVFRERNPDFANLLDDVQNRQANLVDLLQWYVALTFVSVLNGSDPLNYEEKQPSSIDLVKPLIESQWDLITARYGELPYQELFPE